MPKAVARFTTSSWPQGADRESLPFGLAPMLATLSTLPAEGEPYAFEYKWDGVRALAFWDGKRLCLESRNGLEITAQYPELAGLGPALGRHTAALDGEIVAINEHGRASFLRLASRMHLKNPALLAMRTKSTPVDYMVFDLLHLDGHSTRELPYLERRRLLEGLKLQAPRVHVTPFHLDDGPAVLEAAREYKLEGVVAKRLDSRYQPGGRTRAWLKTKLVRGQEFVIGGWQPLAGEKDSVGSLLIGYYETQGRRRVLRYAGRVGTGFTLALRRELAERLGTLAREASPFADPTPGGVHFVKPRLVAQVEFRGWGKTLRQPSFKGLRTDKPAREVVREEPHEETL